MQDQQIPEALRQSIRNMQIIAAALMGGAVMFMLIAGFMPPMGVDQGPGPQQGGTDLNELLPLISSGMGIVFLPISLLVRHMRSRKMQAALDAGDTDTAVQELQQGIIVSYAMLEGAMLFIAVTTLITGKLIPHGIVFAILLAVGLALFPRPSHFQQPEM